MDSFTVTDLSAMSQDDLMQHLDRLTAMVNLMQREVITRDVMSTLAASATAAGTVDAAATDTLVEEAAETVIAQDKEEERTNSIRYNLSENTTAMKSVARKCHQPQHKLVYAPHIVAARKDSCPPTSEDKAESSEEEDEDEDEDEDNKDKHENDDDPFRNFQLPYTYTKGKCRAIKYALGLFPQCNSQPKKGGRGFCTHCEAIMRRVGRQEPAAGTVEKRNAVGLYEYKDNNTPPRSPRPYLELLRKWGLTPQQAKERAAKDNAVIDPIHFTYRKEKRARKRPAAAGAEAGAAGADAGADAPVPREPEVIDLDSTGQTASPAARLTAARPTTSSTATANLFEQQKAYRCSPEFIARIVREPEPVVEDCTQTDPCEPEPQPESEHTQTDPYEPEAQPPLEDYTQSPLEEHFEYYPMDCPSDTPVSTAEERKRQREEESVYVPEKYAVHTNFTWGVARNDADDAEDAAPLTKRPRTASASDFRFGNSGLSDTESDN